MTSRVEATAEWVERELGSVLTGHSPDAVGRTMPLLLLLLARDVGFQHLSERLQSVLRAIMTTAGVVEGASPEENATRMNRFVDALNVDRAVLQDVRRVLDVHRAAMDDARASEFRRLYASSDCLPQSSQPEGATKGPDQKWVGEAAKLLRA